MNILLISEYIRRLNPEDINNFALKQGVTLTEEELQVIYYHVKNNYKLFLTGDPTPILKEVEKEVRPHTYNKIIELYNTYKNKI